MIKRMIILLLTVILTIPAVSIAFVSAQDIDIDKLDKEQLMLLMQAISQKLQQDETSAEGTNMVKQDPSASDPAKDAEDSDLKTLRSRSDPSVVSEKQVTRAIEAKKYQIYENKKLIIGRMPDSMFVPKRTGGGDEEPEPEVPKTPEEEHSCPPSTSYGCSPDRNGVMYCGCGKG